MVRRFIAGWMLVVCCLFGFAENDIEAELRLYDTVTIGEEWSSAGAAVGGLSFQSTGNQNVRAELSLEATLLQNSLDPTFTALFSIPRAFVKVRFPEFRMTAGKTFLSWGQGMAFNAGDLLAGDYNLGEALSGDQIRDAGLWLTSFYLPLERFSFLEGVILLPLADLASLAGGTPQQEVAGGLRWYGRIGELVTETGYLYRYEDRYHRVELSLQGNLLADLYLSASTGYSFEVDAEVGDQLWQECSVSGGLNYLFGIPGIEALSLRVEAEMEPASSWYPEAYAELSFAPVTAWGFLLRGLCHTEDLSFLLMGTASWKMTQGLSFYGIYSVGIGDEADTYSVENNPHSLAVGLQYLY